MKKIISLAMCLSILLIAMISCSNSDKELIGKWKWEADSMVNVIYEFKGSGVMTVSMGSVEFGDYVVVKDICEYTYKNNTITYKFTGKDFKHIESKTYSGSEYEGKSEREELLKTAMMSQEFILENVEVSGDVMTATFNGSQINLYRVKE